MEQWTKPTYEEFLASMAAHPISQAEKEAQARTMHASFRLLPKAVAYRQWQFLTGEETADEPAAYARHDAKTRESLKEGLVQAASDALGGVVARHSTSCWAAGCISAATEAGQRLRACGSCSAARYCSQEHQRADWPRHKKCCKALTRARAAGDADAMEAIISDHYRTMTTDDGQGGARAAAKKQAEEEAEKEEERVENAATLAAAEEETAEEEEEARSFRHRYRPATLAALARARAREQEAAAGAKEAEGARKAEAQAQAKKAADAKKAAAVKKEEARAQQAAATKSTAEPQVQAAPAPVGLPPRWVVPVAVVFFALVMRALF